MPYWKNYHPLFKKKFFWSVFPIQYSVSFTVHQNESATHIHISPFFWISFPFRPSENDRTGNSAIIFFWSFILYFQLHIQPSLVSSHRSLKLCPFSFQSIFKSNLLIILPSAIYCQSMWFSNNLFSSSTNRTRFLKTIIQWFQYLCHLSVVFCWLLFLFWGLPGLWSDKGFSTVFRHLSFYILRLRMLLDSFINQASLTAM